MHKIARYQVGLTKWKAGHQNIRFDSIKSGERFSVEREGRTSDRGLSFSIAHFGNYAIYCACLSFHLSHDCNA